MTINKEQLEIKAKIERLGKILVENSERITQLCIDNDDTHNLDELLLILEKVLDNKKWNITNNNYYI